jgi:hypothetical protein
MNVKYRVTLETSEHLELVAVVLDGKGAFRRLKPAQILLAADSGLSDEEIAWNVAVAASTVWTKQRFVEERLKRALSCPDERRPVVCFDETPRHLIGEERVPVRAEPGKRRRFDCEYVRNGTANVFVFADVNRPWRHAKVTDQRTCSDFAECMRDLVDEHYPDADRIRVVLDNLSVHSAAALY